MLILLQLDNKQSQNAESDTAVLFFFLKHKMKKNYKTIRLFVIFIYSTQTLILTTKIKQGISVLFGLICMTRNYRQCTGNIFYKYQFLKIIQCNNSS